MTLIKIILVLLFFLGFYLSPYAQIKVHVTTAINDNAIEIQKVSSVNRADVLINLVESRQDGHYPCSWMMVASKSEADLIVRYRPSSGVRVYYYTPQNNRYNIPTKYVNEHKRAFNVLK